MVPQSKGKMFLSAERGLNELSWFRSYNTFNFGRYYNEHKMPFGALYVLNEDTLAGGRSITMEVEDDSDIILIPVVGAVVCDDQLVEAGQTQFLSMAAGSSFSVTNPYETELVKFLQLWIKVPGTTAPELISFDLDADRNKLVEISNHVLIGKFDGREEAVHKISRPGNGLFAFVIEGEFEVQYRLLQPGDSLGLWEIDQVELEALSNNAIILIVEMPV
jgi:redox-sensitive bicupin YhaK (pirin superfamily)